MSYFGRPDRGSFPTFTPRGRGYGGPKPDLGNRHYVHGGRGRGRSTYANSPPEANIKEGLDASRIIEKIPLPPRLSTPKDIPIENVEYVASYNWVPTDDPTIKVPGSPAVWTGCPVPITLQPDDGTQFIDQNGARMAHYPMLPLFVAADAIHGKGAPSVDWPAVDVISDRNGLRKLMRWLNPSEGREVRDFRIDVELMGAKTIVLGRWEGFVHNPPTGRSYGFAFEAATARAAPGCPSSGHHRAIIYDILDIKIIVRFEVDACLPTETPDTKPSAEKTPNPSVDDLADALGGIDLTTTPASPSSSSSSPTTINVIRAGTQVPQEALLEVASRSTYFVDQLDWNELYPQLVLSQTPALRLGVHERGKFTELRELQVPGAGPSSDTTTGAGAGASAGWPPDLTVQQRETAAQIVRLARVLEDIQELAIARGPGPAGSFSLVFEGGELRVYGRKGARSCLPPDVRARFSGAGGADADA